MIAANYTEFISKLKEFLDAVEEDNEKVIIKRNRGKGAVVISLKEYNSLMETNHLLSSKANAERLRESIDQLNRGKGVSRKLIE